MLASFVALRSRAADGRVPCIVCCVCACCSNPACLSNSKILQLQDRSCDSSVSQKRSALRVRDAHAETFETIELLLRSLSLRRELLDDQPAAATAAAAATTAAAVADTASGAGASGAASADATAAAAATTTTAAAAEGDGALLPGWLAVALDDGSIYYANPVRCRRRRAPWPMRPSGST